MRCIVQAIREVFMTTCCRAFNECDIQNNDSGNTDVLFHPVNTFKTTSHTTNSHVANTDGLGNKSATWTAPTSPPAGQQFDESAAT